MGESPDLWLPTCHRKPILPKADRLRGGMQARVTVGRHLGVTRNLASDHA